MRKVILGSDLGKFLYGWGGKALKCGRQALWDGSEIKKF